MKTNCGNRNCLSLSFDPVLSRMRTGYQTSIDMSTGLLVISQLTRPGRLLFGVKLQMVHTGYSEWLQLLSPSLMICSKTLNFISEGQKKAKRKPEKRQESSYVSYLDSRYDTYELHSVCNKFRSHCHCHCHQPMNCWAIWAKQGNFYAQKVAFVKESTCWPTKYF